VRDHFALTQSQGRRARAKFYLALGVGSLHGVSPLAVHRLGYFYRWGE
jgi:hypothetical protein